MTDIVFEENSFIFKAVLYDKKTQTLTCNQFDKENNFIKQRKLKFAELPKGVKKKLNPLK